MEDALGLIIIYFALWKKEGFVKSPGHEADGIQGQLQFWRGSKPHGAVGFGRPVPGEGEGDASPHGHLLAEGGPLPVAQVVDLSQLLQVLIMPPVVETSNIPWTKRANYKMQEGLRHRLSIEKFSLNEYLLVIWIKKRLMLNLYVSVLHNVIR